MSQGFIYDQYGNHASKHQDGGVDEVSVVGLSGLLADDQHVLDAEVTAVAIPKSLVAAAGDLIYATASATLARLGITANAKLFGNAAGNAPEYAAGYGINSFARDMSLASGDVAYTGVGFKPSTVIVLATIDGIVDAFSVGFATQTISGTCMAQTKIPRMRTFSSLIYITEVGESDYQNCFLLSMDADGFTLSWTKVGSPTATIQLFTLSLR